METSAEACWRLSKACGQWRWRRGVHIPVGEQIDPPTSENSEATPVEILASSLLTPSSENTQPEVERDWTRPHKRLSLPRSLSSKLWGKSPSR
jgi:hypothetical protein